MARGLGVAILPSLCVEAGHDPDLDKLDAGHLIPPMPHFIGLHPESFVRGYVYDFIETFSPEWTRRRVGRRMRQNPDQIFSINAITDFLCALGASVAATIVALERW